MVLVVSDGPSDSVDVEPGVLCVVFKDTGEVSVGIEVPDSLVEEIISLVESDGLCDEVAGDAEGPGVDVSFVPGKPIVEPEGP